MPTIFLQCGQQKTAWMPNQPRSTLIKRCTGFSQ